MEEMRDLAHYFGRTAFQKEIANQYESIINSWSEKLFGDVVRYIRESEHITDFPKPFEMERIGKKLYISNDEFYNNCKYCDNKGFIIREEYPATADNKMYRFSYKCKCARGVTYAKGYGVPYFSKFDYDNDKGRV